MKKAILTCLAVLLSVSALAVPPVLLTNVVVQSVGEERNHEHLPAGLLFLDADDGRLMIADEDNPHGRAVCACKGYPDYHNLTNTLRANGHRIELNGEYSVQAELGILSVRAGTNSLLRILHSPHGELAPLTCSYETNNTLLLVANAPADSILQICTNLMESPRWSTATNAVIAETTDAATTWRITLLDSPVPEFYRVLSSISLDAGIYASLPLHANAGIEMGGTTWTFFPDIGTIATNAADAAVAPLAAAINALDAYAGALNGRVTINEDDIADVRNDFDGHEASHANPHHVTAAQVGALSTNGGSVRGDIILGTNSTTPAIVFQRMAPNDGNLDYRLRADGAGFFLGVRSSTGTWADHYRFLPGPAFAFGKNTSRAGYYAFAHGEDAAAPGLESFASGYHVTASGFAARATGGWSQALDSYAEAGGYAAVASNEMSHVWNAGTNANYTYGSHGEGTWNINPRGGLAGAYVGETNLADHIAAAVAPVEQRVGELEALHEWPETCCIFWSDDHVTSRWDAETKSINIPTNFPTRRLELIVSDVGITNLTVNLPKWAPDRSVEIFVQVLRASTAPTNRATYVRVNGNSTSALAYTAYNQYRVVILRYDVISATWGTYAYSQPARSYWWHENGNRTTFPTDYPATVEEWIAAYGARKNGTQALAMSSSLSAGHLEAPGGLEALDGEEPDKFDPAEEVAE